MMRTRVSHGVYVGAVVRLFHILSSSEHCSDVHCSHSTEDGPDAGEFMVQCEMCKVWQHGLCMGYNSEDQLDEDYYCEECKPELHVQLLKYVPFTSSHPKSSAYPHNPFAPLLETCKTPNAVPQGAMLPPPTVPNPRPPETRAPVRPWYRGTTPPNDETP